MIIHSMTATFGKLEHETLSLNPGLNIIHAPNEWGKSTWCAFLVAMLYGLDTRAKSTKTALADKERYAPWSGNIMAGRMDITWNGRNITIERKTKGRVPLGDFRAYETDSGLAVAELTAANCGSLLLGVERSVFVRSGFIRFQDLPVTGDDALRRRLNALVTTGDESGTADALAKKLREQKNRIRYNRTGLLPQAENERSELEETLRELEALQAQAEKTKGRLLELGQWNLELQNHRAALAYEASRQDANQVEEARLTLEASEKKLRKIEAECQTLPPREQAERVLSQIRELQERQSTLQFELRTLPEPETEVEVPKAFLCIPEDEIPDRAKADSRKFASYRKRGRLLLILALLLAVSGGVLAYWYCIPDLVCAGLGAVLLLVALAVRLHGRSKAKKLASRYGTSDTRQWIASAERYVDALNRQKLTKAEADSRRQFLIHRLKELDGHIRSATNGESLEKCRRDWENAISLWDAWADASREHHRAEKHYQILRNMAKSAPPPEFPDGLDFSEADTLRLLSDCLDQRQKLENRLGQCQGRMEALGTREELEKRLVRLSSRIQRLEETYAALTIAQETLTEATAELQRRFALKCLWYSYQVYTFQQCV